MTVLKQYAVSMILKIVENVESDVKNNGQQ